ncbi:MAG: UbiA family prenyltransferase [Bacteroidetes bacterium]|nr:UbiA family prenyltransferase [Bacteroidota bacterium]
MHRIVGLEKVAAFHEQGRFRVIARYKNHIRVYAVAGAIGAAWFFFRLEPLSRWLMIPSGLISLAYVIPFSNTGLRLRDIHYVKIFLIALVFSWVSVFLPVFETGHPLEGSHWYMLAERCLFLLAITLPFDSRDLRVDEHTQVKTIPTLLGKQKSMQLALLLITLAAILALLNWNQAVYPTAETLGYLAGLILTAALIRFSPGQKHDYYFSGLLDGSMLLIFLCTVLAAFL